MTKATKFRIRFTNGDFLGGVEAVHCHPMVIRTGLHGSKLFTYEQALAFRATWMNSGVGLTDDNHAIVAARWTK